MKINSSGMAISSILYSILVLFLVLLFGILTLLASGKYSLDKIKAQIINKLSGDRDTSITSAKCFNFDYNTGTIKGFYFGMMGCSGDVVIPESIDYVVVKSIDNNAFYNEDNYEIDNLDFSNAKYLSSIGDNAFRERNIGSINFGNLINLLSIGNYAFASTGVSEIFIDNLPMLNSIGSYAFANNSISNFSFASLNGLQNIGEYAFYNNLLTTLTLPNSIKIIGEYAYGLNSLTAVTLGNSLNSIGQAAFDNNFALVAINIDMTSGSITGSPWGAVNAMVNWKS